MPTAQTVPVEEGAAGPAALALAAAEPSAELAAESALAWVAGPDCSGGR